MNETVKHLQDYDTGTRFLAAVLSSERITGEDAEAEVRELVLEVDRPEFHYQVGQSMAVIAPGDPRLGRHEHIRLYTLSDLPERLGGGKQRIKLCVRRCHYIDDYSGEVFPGIASNYLCDRTPGDTVTMAGPFGIPFQIPEEPDATLVLIGTGTGIAPFRAFVKHIYREHVEFRGRVWLFYGARTGVEALYMNDKRQDFTQYYDEETFRAFQAFSPRPSWVDPIAWDEAIGDKAQELWLLLAEPSTYVYVAGLVKMRAQLDETFTRIAGSAAKWERRKAELVAGGRWVELMY